ncbi:MAG TPA: hypothetical protein VF970_00570 [Gemmatimonadales bacterium]
MPVDPRPAPPFGRGLRFLVGVLLMADVVPLYLRVGRGVAWGAMLVMLLLAAVYGAWHMIALRRLARVNSWMGAFLAVGVLVAVYVAGGPGGLLFGRGEGELGAVTYLGVSLITAALRGDGGCEVMALPGLVSGKRVDLRCLVFCATDWVEDKLRGRRNAP